MLMRRWGSCLTADGDRILPVAEYLRTRDLVKDEVLVMIKPAEIIRQFFQLSRDKRYRIFVSCDKITK